MYNSNSSNSTPVDAAALSSQVRGYVYRMLLAGRRMPAAAVVANHVGISIEEVRAAFVSLQDAHMLVLQEGDEEILMANPFSAVPTSFLVEIGAHSWWGNCIWDAMGIAAMVKGEARISTGCGDCNDAMSLLVANGRLASYHGAEGIVHFSVPARHWWDNIKFT